MRHGTIKLFTNRLKDTENVAHTYNTYNMEYAREQNERMSSAVT